MNTSSRPLDYYLLWLVALTSLAINVFLLRSLLIVRHQAGEAAAQAAQSVAKLRESSIDYVVTVQKDVPISVVVPISTTVTVPINAIIPLNTQVTVPLQTPFGEFPVSLPVQASIPVNLQTTVPVTALVPFETVVPVVLDIPVHLVISDTAFGQSLKLSEDYLNQLAVSLQTSLLPTR